MLEVALGDRPGHRKPPVGPLREGEKHIFPTSRFEKTQRGSGLNLFLPDMTPRKSSSFKNQGPNLKRLVVSFFFKIFTPYLGKIPILTNIFPRGWNHQLDNLCVFFGCETFRKVLRWTLKGSFPFSAVFWVTSLEWKLFFRDVSLEGRVHRCWRNRSGRWNREERWNLWNLWNYPGFKGCFNTPLEHTPKPLPKG